MPVLYRGSAVPKGLKVTQQQCMGVVAIINTTKPVANKIISKMSYLRAAVLMTVPSVSFAL